MGRQIPARRLSAADIRVLRRAGQRELKRSAKAELDPERERRCAELRRALAILRQFRDGCELHAIYDEGTAPIPEHREPARVDEQRTTFLGS